MLSFWANYVLLKEQQGQLRETTLSAIEAKFGAALQQQIESELSA